MNNQQDMVVLRYLLNPHLMVLALWLVLRKKEELQRKRREEDKIERK